MALSAISAIDVKDIPTPRPSGWVVDQTGQVNADTIRQLNQIGDEVHQRDGAEIAVVVIPKIVRFQRRLLIGLRFQRKLVVESKCVKTNGPICFRI